MKAGILQFLLVDITTVMVTRGILLPSGDYDETKLDTLQEDAQFAADVEAVLAARGVPIPEVVDAIVHTLPLLGLFIRLRGKAPVAPAGLRSVEDPGFADPQLPPPLGTTRPPGS